MPANWDQTTDWLAVAAATWGWFCLCVAAAAIADRWTFGYRRSMLAPLGWLLFVLGWLYIIRWWG